MNGQSAALLASLSLLAGCHYVRPDHTDARGVPPPPREEITWESFFWEPWPDPLHEKYEELFGRPYPNPGEQHFETDRPFSDVRKFDLAFADTAVPGTRVERASAEDRQEVALELPGSAGLPIAVRADERFVRLTVARPRSPRRYRVYPTDELVLPLPEGADPATARVARDGDRVRITFLARRP